ncbi:MULTISPECIES: envelope stress sensor histidine kinase CpxA [Vibrio]|uniref:histidine kinase n=1 Tax=Vibrio algicola TaxID=2662262 RepID=A0A5Q0TK48_9VIBR|nr:MULTISPECIES: envelope stress sensor histidine kinase CpxA [Vibrio]MBD1576044.1 envelope stress sensor histidine kinase CpxA [Vibrio sp. S11_S32]
MKLPKISSLYGRIFAIFWLTMLLVVIAILTVSNLDPRQLHDIPEQPLARLQQHAQSITKKFESAPSLMKAIHEIDHQYDRDKQIDFYFAKSNADWVPAIRSDRKKALNNFITLSDIAGKPQQRLYNRLMVAGPIPVVIAHTPLKMFVTIRWHRPPPFLLQILDRPVQLLLAVMLTSTPLLLWLAWALSRPAMRLEKAAQKVALGQLEVDPKLEKGPTEFKQAGASFNQMVLSINNMIQGQQRLLSDISHELRSPLTRLRMANALATRKQGESAELTRIDTEAERLESMINALLELSRKQADTHEVRQHLLANELWQEMVNDAQFEAEQMGKKLHSNSVPTCYLTGTPYLLTSAIENVVRNAIKYSHQQIWLNFSYHQDHIRIVIEDDGEGVDELELEAIFRPFYRVSTARDRDSGGAGLGLAITSSAVHQHNGTIQAAHSQRGGLGVTITLPINA